ncbi:hypothetical protein E2C01_073325 [Portunus trituberculatus]|uniref:Uncharacterized protein n=1 Tax=Portunus trituberculatus TaxID=210409 RepID=A0A5B7IBE6_PORTR|nr:hypothetical protein [Portunus trituberculatus]
MKNSQPSPTERTPSAHTADRHMTGICKFQVPTSPNHSGHFPAKTAIEPQPTKATAPIPLLPVRLYLNTSFLPLLNPRNG